MASVRISPTDQIALPPEAREALRVHAGEELLVAICGDIVILTRKPEDFAGAISGLGRSLYPEGYLDSERESWD